MSASRISAFLTGEAMVTGMQVPFFDYRAHFRDHEEEYVRIFRDVMGRGAFILQREVEEFEQALAEFVGVKHAIAVADGTNAIILGLRALGLGRGDEVIFPSHTFVATHSAITWSGATAVACDIGPDGLMDPVDAEARIGPRTRAIMPVQLNGRVCDMDRLSDLASRHGLLLCEDSCQALGARYRGQSAGTFGRFGVFSFYPAKSLGCFGDGGAFITNDDELAQKVRWMRDHGRPGGAGGVAVIDGTNSRLDNLQAAILHFKLREFPAIIERRRDIARRYRKGLGGIPALVLPPGPDDDPDHFDTFQNYEIRCRYRDLLRAYLASRGIQSVVQWGGSAVHQMPVYHGVSSLPRTEAYFEGCLLLPMNQYLTDEQVEHVISSVQEFFKEIGKSVTDEVWR